MLLVYTDILFVEDGSLSLCLNESNIEKLQILPHICQVLIA